MIVCLKMKRNFYLKQESEILECRIKNAELRLEIKIVF